MDYKRQLQRYKRRRERIMALFADGKTSEQVARRMGITPQRARQINKEEREKGK